MRTQPRHKPMLQTHGLKQHTQQPPIPGVWQVTKWNSGSPRFIPNIVRYTNCDGIRLNYHYPDITGCLKHIDQLVANQAGNSPSLYTFHGNSVCDIVRSCSSLCHTRVLSCVVVCQISNPQTPLFSVHLHPPSITHHLPTFKQPSAAVYKQLMKSYSYAMSY